MLYPRIAEKRPDKLEEEEKQRRIRIKESYRTDNTVINRNQKLQIKKPAIQRFKRTKEAEEGSESSKDEYTESLYCHGLYCETTEGWITC